MLPVYATVEQIESSLEVAASTYTRSLILRKLNAASRGIEDLCHRRFYPELRTTRYDWPNYSYSATWRLDLDGNELISLTSLLSGDGTDISSNAILRREDDVAEPPYSAIEMDLSGNSSFQGGDTFQQSLAVLGVHGWNDTATSLAGAAIGTGGVDDNDTVFLISPTSGTYDIGIGALLLCGTERMLITNRRMADTVVDTSSALLDLQSANSFTVTDGTAFAEDEVIMLDAERMRIAYINGNTLIVQRAWDASTLAEHSSGTSIYALRNCTVQRGVLGSTAASHAEGTAVYVHEFPGPINELCVAETVVMLEQNASGYARTVGSGGREIETAGMGLEDARARAIQSCGRISRLAGI